MAGPKVKDERDDSEKRAKKQPSPAASSSSRTVDVEVEGQGVRRRRDQHVLERLQHLQRQRAGLAAFVIVGPAWHGCQCRLGEERGQVPVLGEGKHHLWACGKKKDGAGTNKRRSASSIWEANARGIDACAYEEIPHLPHRVPPGFHGNWVAD